MNKTLSESFNLMRDILSEDDINSLNDANTKGDFLNLINLFSNIVNNSLAEKLIINQVKNIPIESELPNNVLSMYYFLISENSNLPADIKDLSLDISLYCESSEDYILGDRYTEINEKINKIIAPSAPLDLKPII